MEGRQEIASLERNRIDPSKPNSYISSTSPVNYESSNPLEYGDAIGYNETLERLDVEQYSDQMVYVHMPVWPGG